MDIISFNEAATANGRIEKFNANPDSNSGVLTQPKVIEAGETVTIKSGRQAVLANTVIDGELIIEAGGDIFIPAGAGFNDLDQRIDRLETLQIGAILNGYTIFDNCIVAFGGEFNRTDYPKLWAYLQSNPTLVKTEAQWQSESTTNDGICGFFSDGDGTTTFRVPNLDKAFLRPDRRSVGSFQADTIRNITGVIQSIWEETGGAFYNNSVSSRLTTTGGGNGLEYYRKQFDASRVVPTADENRPKNIAVLPLIVAK